MNLVATLILALAISVDGFVVGITYGLKKIKISFLPILIISVASGLTMFASMSLGTFLSRYLSTLRAEQIGGVMLILIGFWLSYQSRVNNVDKTKEYNGNIVKEIFTLKIKPLGLMINLLKEPVKADLDYSGNISSREAIFLGIALALDAFGSGIAAAMTGYNSMLTAIAVSMFKFIFLSLGIYLGKEMGSLFLDNKVKLLPGIILILLGLFKLI